MSAPAPVEHNSDALVDLIIMGGGAAGMTAALTAQRSGLSVKVFERESDLEKPSIAGWLSPLGVKLCEDIGLTAEAVEAEPFTGLTLHAWNFDAQCHIDDDDLNGWYIDRARFDRALHRLVRAAGVAVAYDREVVDLALGEDEVTVTLGDQSTHRGRLLLIADGVFSRGAELADLIPAGRMRGILNCAQMVTHAPGAKPGIAVVLGRSVGAQLGTLITGHDRIRVTISGSAEPNELMRTLRDFCADAIEHGVIPKTAAEVQAGGIMPAAAALELDTHVGKRCLLIGDAGGFLTAFSNEGLYPAMRSGMLAAEVAADALQADLPQDALSAYSIVWRQELADYLRMPNADLGLLLPLIFRSEAMATRVARAFLLGADL